MNKYYIPALDIKKSHEYSNIDCKMRIIQEPNGHWRCFDCGYYILQSVVELFYRNKQNENY